jgi:hypothetical protein
MRRLRIASTFYDAISDHDHGWYRSRSSLRDGGTCTRAINAYWCRISGIVKAYSNGIAACGALFGQRVGRDNIAKGTPSPLQSASRFILFSEYFEFILAKGML